MIQLVPATVDLLDAAVAGDSVLAGALGRPVVGGWCTFANALPRTREAVAAAGGDTDWGPRLFIAGSELVGWGGFKGPPRDGAVELGYEIAASRRERGLATAAVRAMVAEAFADARVDTVIAHTLPERNASNRVLEKAGFHRDGEADEGVWRFALSRQARDGLSAAPA